MSVSCSEAATERLTGFAVKVLPTLSTPLDAAIAEQLLAQLQSFQAHTVFLPHLIGMGSKNPQISEK